MSAAAFSQDPRYALGVDCTWHGPLQQAVKRRQEWQTPCCRSSLRIFATEGEFWDEMQRQFPGPLAQAKLRWGKGRHHLREENTFDDAYALDHLEDQTDADQAGREEVDA